MDPTPVPPAPLPVGRHVLAELTDVDAAVLDDVAALRGALHDALGAAGAQVRQIVAEAFAPQGATVVALLAESHASVHTWPEYATAHVDVFTCGDAADPELAVRLLAAALGASVRRLDVIERGGPAAAVTEPISPGLTRRWALGTVHHRATTPYQRVLIADTAHGVTLFCDDERQSAEATQLVYHEALFAPAALLAARCERVLVIGSSEGVVSEMAVAAGATRVDHVDIDPDCVRACAEHLPYGYTPGRLAAAERHEGPVHVHYGDGREFVERAAGRYDVIVVDLPDERPDEPEAQLNRLYAADFLAGCAQRLTEGGVVVCQAGSPALWRDATLRAAWRRFHDVFGPGGVVYAGSDEHEWAFLVGCPAAPADPVTTMVARLATLPVPPATIDAAWLRTRTVPPATLRRGFASAARHDDAGDGRHGRSAMSTPRRSRSR
ncbi:adenosylmethionine decarboxylase [Pseudonocardia bannensis]|uniref:S-adenosylmethionine decarboxylase proenzyme n=1 Tax=Pseudonocardia bannensis TaxID=630973 RepID=A0A848DHP8_9PSEU|nr:adenosylmethionine decarboxylase [Pseudonocardia bannensis]